MQASATVGKAAVLYRVPLPASPRFKVLDLLIKILVPLGLLMSFWAVVQIGSLEGYLRLFSLQNYDKSILRKSSVIGASVLTSVHSTFP